MKLLCIVRHAKTEVQQQGQIDFNRRLIDRGLKDAAETASKLKEMKIEPDLILSSPAARAISTATIFSKKFHYPEFTIEQNSLIYNASVNALIKIVQGLDDSNKCVFLIGHNPGLTLLANFLSLPPILHIPTSGAVIIDFDIKHWKEITGLKGKQRYFMHP